MTPLAAYLLLFVAVGIGFIFVHLMAGKLIRPAKPDPAKQTIYECGEPTIGSAWIQFDLRFYVVALLFVIFDVEVAFFFPWAVVFGKSNSIIAMGEPKTAEDYHRMGEVAWDLMPPAARPEHSTQHERMLSIKPEEVGKLPNTERVAAETLSTARTFSWLALVEIAVFFGVLLVGFAYLWSRGDLAWVRSLAAERPANEPLTRAPTPQPVAQALASTDAHA